MEEIIDLTACLAKGKTIRVDEKEYEIKFGYGALRSLEVQYGNVNVALDSFIKRENLYDDTVNFLYAACGERYKLKKTDVEEWISISSAPILYDVIFEALLSSIGTSGGNEEQGEA